MPDAPRLPDGWYEVRPPQHQREYATFATGEPGADFALACKVAQACSAGDSGRYPRWDVFHVDRQSGARTLVVHYCHGVRHWRGD